MFEAEREAFKLVLKLPRATLRETMAFALLYAAQAVVAVLLLNLLFSRFGWPGGIWAVISAILALQPGWSQSVVTSVIRIVATCVGAGVALLVSCLHFPPEIQLVLSLVVTVLFCELMRLDPALRTACVAVVIVLTQSQGHLFTTGEDRFFATIAGCLMALLVQLATDLVREWVGKKRIIAVLKS